LRKHQLYRTFGCTAIQPSKNSLGLKGIKKKVKAFLYVLFSGFLGIFGFANLAPNSSVGNALGQSLSQQSISKGQLKKNAPETPLTQKAENPKGKEPGASRSVRAPAFWKPTPQKRKKHTNLHKCKAKGKRNRKLKRSK
jgi:hypothetical protein